MAKKTSKKSKKTGRKKSEFKYRARSRESYERSASESSGSFDSYVKDGTSRFQPHDGNNRIRILPPTFEDPDSFALSMLVHYRVGADEQTYLCRKMLDNDEDCAICDEYSKRVLDGEADEAVGFKQKKRKAIWLIDRKAEEDGPQFWAMPFGTWKDVVLVCKDEDGDVIDLDEPNEGRDVLFTKEGAQLRTKYTGVRLGKQRPIFDNDNATEDALEFVQENPLDKVLNFYENEYLRAVLEGKSTRRTNDDDDDEEEEEEDSSEESEDEEDEEDESSEDEDEEDEEVEEEEDDDEDDEEEEDEDEDEEDEDEEEEEEKPRKRSRVDSDKSAKNRLKAAAQRAREATAKGKKSGKRRR